MNKNDLHQLKDWFANYVSSYKTGDPEYNQNIVLKEEHTHRVCEEILYLGRALKLNDNDLIIAETTALLHDVGRFEQYRRFKTFSDADSVDHAQLSASIIKEEKLLESLDASETDLILRAVSYHNRRYLPEGETERCLFFCRMLRDADKIDIWKVCVELFSLNSNGGPSGITQLFPDKPGISEDICNDLLSGKSVNNGDVKNLNDQRLLQVGWIYDINFKPSFIRIWERNYLQMLYDSLPRHKRIEEVFKVAHKHLKEQIAQQP